MTDYDLLRSSCGVLANPAASLFELSGADARDWLQGQITNDMRLLRPGGSLPFCICSPTGQIVTWGTVWDHAGRLFVSVPDVGQDPFIRRAEEMVIVEEVEVQLLSDRLQLVSIQGPTANEELKSVPPKPETVALPSDRNGMGGWDLWVPREHSSDYDHLPKVGDEALNVATLESGIPVLGRDAGPKTLPPELGPHFENLHVSYRKGCYTGQEVLMRIHSRGHTNWTWMAVLSSSVLDPEMQIRQGDQEIGRIIRTGFSERFGFIASARVRQRPPEESPDRDVLVGRSSVPALFAEMPLLKIG